MTSCVERGEYNWNYNWVDIELQLGWSNLTFFQFPQVSRYCELRPDSELAKIKVGHAAATEWWTAMKQFHPLSFALSRGGAFLHLGGWPIKRENIVVESTCAFAFGIHRQQDWNVPWIALRFRCSRIKNLTPGMRNLEQSFFWCLRSDAVLRVYYS